VEGHREGVSPDPVCHREAGHDEVVVKKAGLDSDDDVGLVSWLDNRALEGKQRPGPYSGYLCTLGGARNVRDRPGPSTRCDSVGSDR
jgi:hypothetical protein